jgi:uncharacterized protein YndB with AHSA1/START domain
MMETTSDLELAVDYDRQEIVFKRVFDAPRDLVWKVITDPALVPLWWGPAYLTTTVEKMDVRPGGQWRFIQHAPDGAVHAFNGVYQEVNPPERLVQTFEYEPFPGQISTESVALTELPEGKTLWTATAHYPTIEHLRGVVESGMEGGARETYDRLAALLPTRIVAGP